MRKCQWDKISKGHAKVNESRGMLSMPLQPLLQVSQNIQVKQKRQPEEAGADTIMCGKVT
jgi:hypothetical protein